MALIKNPKLIQLSLRLGFKPVTGFLPWTWQRRLIDRLGFMTSPAKNVESEVIRLGRLETLRIRPTAGAQRKILFLHGGGFCVGSYRSHFALLSHIAAHCEAEVFCPEYRMAPEHPFPAGMDDCLNAYQALLAMPGKTGKPFLAGDSAGGGLALSTAMNIRDQALPMPRGLILISPWLDLRSVAKSRTERADREPMLSNRWIERCTRAYIGDAAVDDPNISPLLRKLDDLPATLVQVGTEEILHDDSVTLNELAKEFNTEVTLQIYEGMWHDFQTFGGIVPEADTALHRIGDFAKNCD